jgi:hypothetical protein
MYGLTPDGGAAWEALTHPDWNLFVDHWTSIEPKEACIEAASRDKAFAEYQRDGDPHNPSEPIAETLREEVLVPWRATYWKTLTSGYRLRYAWRSLPPRRLSCRARLPRADPSPEWYSRPGL